MSHKQHYLDTNVYEEGKKRIELILDRFDTVFVAFSGGKDSLVLLHLTEEVYEDLGRKDKINVIFRDEELIPDDIIDFVNKKRTSGKYNFIYSCLMLASEKYVLGEKVKYIQWDNKREHIREVPDYAVTCSKVYSQYSSDDKLTENYGGSKCVMTGIRTSESIFRLKAVLNKKNDTFVAKQYGSKIKLGRPIYDWSEKDIFKYLHDNRIDYCEIYDNQLFNKVSLRVSTPLHAESSKNIHKLKTQYPYFHERLRKLFPDIENQARYYQEFKRGEDSGVFDKYGVTWEGIFAYIDENITDTTMNKLAKRRVIRCKRTRSNKKGTTNYGGYPIRHVFNAIVKGSYKREIQPKPKPTKKDILCEEKNKYNK